MRIAFICKRQYMGKDVIADRYARLYEIPSQLAKLGHTVSGSCLSYQGHEEGLWQHDALPGKLTWESRSLGRTYVPALLTYPQNLLRRLREFAPDIVIGASDIPHVALAGWLSKRLAVPFVADLYDNFEGFGQARIPGMVAALRRAVRNADLVTTTSEPLRELVVDGYGARGLVIAMPSTVDKTVFRSRERIACRQSLGLPESVRLIGTAGGLYRDKGVETLYEAWKIVSEQRSDVHLVLAGPTDPRFPPPTGDRIHTLGMLPHARTAELFNALDVGAICIRDTPFGRYCFPQKAYEMLACGLPVAAASVGAMTHLLADVPSCLYRADDAKSLATTLLSQLDRPVVANVGIEDWVQLIGSLEPQLQKLLAISLRT
ncbi:glycosyltransferase family 4 protein [Stenotrophobium rhamnosiphilum]|uniref:Group 1 glycosyl transferase n=1 Tax=Stenotrophobium rhamnosiphilum TaxID=2029166 RepID=A0A2T5MDM2_9GAMM|nr:glycosyltransferase family 4 protein [Stenotrophobium rhamnosiphilum]PTU30674.1 group 1 glycosyl transferase [Stenotrophobium rhamnosiphilum]